MADTAGLSPEDAAAARAAEQARIRKERREAKIKAGGSARLNKITGLGGGVQRDPIPTTTASDASSPAATPAQQASSAEQHHADPDEVDISNAEHYYKPETTNRVPRPDNFDPADINEDQLRQMMLGLDRPAAANGAGGPVPPSPFAAMMGMGMGGPGGEGGPDPDDPMMKMLSQMMGGGAGGPPGPGGMPSFGGVQNPFAAMSGQPQAAAAAIPDSYAAIWRVLHFIVAMGLGLYIALLTQFTGTKVERERGAFAYTTASEEGVADLRKYFFYAFATAESVLLTSRFFLDKGRAPPSGIVHMVLGFLPGKWKTLASNGLRYAQIFSTIRNDILVCVFVLGICSLFRA
ncbi:unnamed protein product [Discula destructiva]